MKELQQALAEIHSIRSDVARGTEFRGYGPASIAASGVLALLVAAAQAQWLAKHPGSDVWLWIAVWAGTAAASLLMSSAETFARARRVHRGFAREMLQSAVEQFLPAGVAGALLTAVLWRYAPQTLWMLPGLWQIVFGLGVFSSCRFLPRPMLSVSVSPRRTALNQTLVSSAKVTRPMTCALSATQAVSASWGAASPI